MSIFPSIVADLFCTPGEKERIEKQKRDDKIRRYPKQLTGETRFRSELSRDRRILAVLEVRKKYIDENNKTWLAWCDADITDLQYFIFESKLK